MTESNEASNHSETINVISSEHAGLAAAMLASRPPEDVKTKRRRIARDTLFGVTVLISLLFSFYVAVHKNILDDKSVQLFKDGASRTICVGRYQDAVDAASADTLATIGELVVIIVRTPPGSAREAAIGSKIDELDKATDISRQALNAKILYNNRDRPLPCPIGETQPTPEP